MKLYRIGIIGLGISAALAAVGSAISAATEKICDLCIQAFACLAPEPMQFAGDEHFEFRADGNALDAGLQNGMRHEARMSRRSAPRNI